MNTDISKTDHIRSYLLDGLSEEESQAVEERFFSDDSAFDEMVAVEDELFYEFQQDELNTSERTLFEQKFLRSREDHERAAFAGAFLNATGEMARGRSLAPVSVVEDRPSLFQSIAAFFNIGSAFQFGVAAAALLLSIGVIGLLVQNSRMRSDLASIQQQNDAELREKEAQITEKQREQQEIENQLAAEREKATGSEDRIKELESERQKLAGEIAERRNRLDRAPKVSQPSGKSTIATLVISPGFFTRSDGEPMNRVVLTPAMRNLKLRLTLKNVDEYKKFGVTVTSVDGDDTILIRPSLTAVGKGAKRSLTLNIPTKSLQRADYEVILTGVTKTGETEDITKYYFSVDR